MKQYKCGLCEQVFMLDDEDYPECPYCGSVDLELDEPEEGELLLDA